MADDEAYELIRNGDMNGWVAVHKKYLSKKYFPKNFPQSNVFVHTAGINEEIWADAIMVLYNKIRTGQFVKQKEGEDFLLPGIIGIAKLMLLNHGRQKRPTPLSNWETPVACEADEAGLGHAFDMLMASICVERLEEPYRSILLVKYFPQTPEDALKTDETLAEMLEQRGLGTWDKAKFGVYRRRSIAKMGQFYAALDKSETESTVNQQGDSDLALLNLCFPTGYFWGILFNKGKKYLEETRLANAVEYLAAVRANEATEVSDRLRVYLSLAVTWMNRIEKRQVDLSVDSISSRLKDLLKAFGTRLLTSK